jgi:hypothetical protein
MYVYTTHQMYVCTTHQMYVCMTHQMYVCMKYQMYVCTSRRAQMPNAASYIHTILRRNGHVYLARYRCIRCVYLAAVCGAVMCA